MLFYKISPFLGKILVFSGKNGRIDHKIIEFVAAVAALQDFAISRQILVFSGKNSKIGHKNHRIDHKIIEFVAAVAA